MLILMLMISTIVVIIGIDDPDFSIDNTDIYTVIFILMTLLY